METVERRPGKINIAAAIILAFAFLLGYVSYLQQKSPLCRALSGQASYPGITPDILFQSADKSSSFALKIKEGGPEIQEKYSKDADFYKKIEIRDIPCENEEIIKKNEKSEKKGLFCRFSAENMRNFAEKWRKNPKNLLFAAEMFFSSETDMDMTEKISLSQAVLREGLGRSGKLKPLPLKLTRKEIASARYTAEIMNASGQNEASELAAAWLEQRGFNTVIVSGTLAKQEKTEIFSYGSNKAAEELKRLICPAGDSGICPISVFEKKNSIEAAIVIGSDYKKAFSGSVFPFENAEAKKDQAKKTAKTVKKIINTQKKNVQKGKKQQKNDKKGSKRKN